MNTVITPIIDDETDEVLGYDYNDKLGEQVLRQLVRNNAFLPNVERVVYNTDLTARGGGEDRPSIPVLVTVVYFVDGTKVTVKNSDKDGITLVDKKVKLSDGQEITVRTASDESKEIGLVYALAKRMVCEYDEDGNVMNAGFAGLLRKLVGKARCQDVEQAKLDKERKNAKAAADKPKKETLRDTVRNLAGVVEGLKTLVDKLAPASDSESEADAKPPRED